MENMHKRTVLSGAFALPGLANDSQKSTPRDRISRKRRDIDQYSVEIETPRTTKTSAKGTKTRNTYDDTSSLVDRRGEFLPQSTNGRLKHLTKSRPRSPARRPGSNTTRNRSRSPDLRRDSFDFTLGLNNNTEPETTYSKQSTGKAEKNHSLNSKSNASRKSNVVKDSNLPTNTMSNNDAESSRFDSYSKERVSSNYDSKDSVDSELSQQEFNSYSDEDLGDMLMGDYIDSDESVSDSFKPPLPNSPPPMDEEISTQNKISGPTSPKVESDKSLVNKSNSSDRIKEDISKNMQRNYSYNDTNNTTNDLHSSGINDSSIMSKGKTFSLSGQSSTRHSTQTQSINQSSSRRRRFKPVSVDDVIAESDVISKTSNFKTDSNDNEKMNRTFPGNYSERLSFESGSSSSSGYKRDIDWGLGTGPLNTSLSESTLKTGTIFDKFLKRKEREPEENKRIDNSAMGAFVTTQVDDKVALSSVEIPSNGLNGKRSHRRAIADMDFQENNSYDRTEENNLDIDTRKQNLNMDTIKDKGYDDNDDDDEKDNTYDTDSYDANILDYANDIDGDDEDDTHHSDDNIKVAMNHLMLESHPMQSHTDIDNVDSNANTSGEESVLDTSVEDGENIDMTNTFDFTTERTCLNGVYSPGEILLDEEGNDNNSLNMSQGLYVASSWAENDDATEYAAEVLNKERSDSNDDDEGRDENLEAEDLPDDVDYIYPDNEDYVQNAGNESLHYLNQG